jgi:GcrA cell cycle regulator
MDRSGYTDWGADDRRCRLTALWSDGLPTREIARLLGVTKNAVIGQAHRLKLPPRPSPISRAATAHETKPPAAPRPPPTPPGRAATTRRDERPPPTGPVSCRTSPATTRPLHANPVTHGTGCAWPFGEPRTSDFHFCGEPVRPGRPYCEAHAARAYRRAETTP